MSEWVLLGTAGLIGFQSLLMLVDEVVYHRRRHLSRVEAVGHTFDMLVFLATILLPAFAAPTTANLLVYSGLAVVSTLVVTKDEWLHARDCVPEEHWIHSLLFVLHGPLLTGLGYCWAMRPDATWLKVFPLMVGAWGAYQAHYWIKAHAQDNRHSVVGEQRLLRRPRRALVSR